MNDNTDRLYLPLKMQMQSDEERTRSDGAEPAILLQATDAHLHELQVRYFELERQNEQLRQAQTALEESRDRYAGLYDFAPVTYLTLSADGLITDINLTGATLFGVLRNQLIGQRFAHYISPSDQDRWHCLFIGMKQHPDEQKHNIDLFLVPGNDRTLNVHCDCLAMPRESALPELRITLTNITHIKQAAGRLEKIASRVPGMVYQFHATPKDVYSFPYCSDGILDLFRLSPEQVRTDASAMFACIHPDDLNAVLSSIQHSQKNLSVWVCEFRVCLDDSAEHWLKGNAMPQAEPDGSTLWHGFITDITQDKLQDIKYQTIIETSTNGFWCNDFSGRLLTVNKALCEMLGYSTQELLGMSIMDIEVLESPEETRKHIDTIMQTGHDTFVTQHRRKNGRIIDVEVNVLYEQKLGPRFFVFINNITERKKIEATHAFLSQAVHLNTDESFFDALARYLADSLEMNFVCIKCFNRDGLTAQTLTVYHNGVYKANGSYALKGTPCGVTVNQGIFCCPDRVCERFPEDERLTSLHAESYAGATLWSSSGKPMGLVAVIGEKPLVSRDLAISVLKIVAVRAAGELERNGIETALRTSEQQLQLVLQGGHLGFWDWNLVTNTVQRNSIWAEMLGYSFEDIQQTTRQWEDFVHPDDRQQAWRSIRNALDGLSSYHEAEYRMQHKDGSFRWILDHASVVACDSSGKPTRMAGIHTDITRRKQVEQAFAEEKLFTEIALNSQRDTFFVFDPASGQAIRWNRVFRETSGYTNEEISRLRAPDSYYSPEDLEKVPPYIERLMRGERGRIELSLICKDGRKIPTEYETSVIEFNRGEVNHVYLLAIGRDISERKYAELFKQFRSHTLELLAGDHTLSSILNTIVTGVEQLNPAMRCSILLLDSQGKHLDQGVAPSLPDFYNAAIDGIEIGYGAGSCGTAAFTKERVIAEDITTHPFWAAYTDLAAKAGLGACWSQPILSSVEQVLGTFAIYYPHPHTPTPSDIELIEQVSRLTSIAIERKQTETELRIAATVFESQEGMMITDTNNFIVKVNHAFSRITGYCEAEAIGQNPRLLSSGRHDAAFYRALWQSIHETGAWQGEIWNRRKSGECYPEWLNITAVSGNNDGSITHYVATMTDISERKATEEHINTLAFYDPLTLLPNRRLLYERLKHGIEFCRRTGNEMAVLMLDLDKFKPVNDHLGHAAGDKLLKQVANRIKACVREVDTVARLGGDEFVIIMEKLEYSEHIARVASAVIHSLTQAFELGGNHKIYIGASIGIGIYPKHGDTVEALLDNADAALYHAKDSGRGCFSYFSEELTQQARERMALEARLRRALEQQELQVYFQPQIDMVTGQIIGAEALVRWHDPEFGLIMPNHFIALAEETSLIFALGEWVLRETCTLGQQWLDQGLPAITLAVNVSPHQFRRGDLNALVARILHETRFPGSSLELEITESGLMANQDHAQSILYSLSQEGVLLAIDDFGTGYSSLAYLKYFPLDVLKIDKTFIDDLQFSKGDRAITGAIIAMAHHLGFKVLAEGVETQDQFDFLLEHGCDRYQGFFFNEALSASAFTDLLRSYALTAG